MRRKKGKEGGKNISLRSNKRKKILICSDITVVYIWPFERTKFILVYKYQLQSHLKVTKAIYPPFLLFSISIYRFSY